MKKLQIFIALAIMATFSTVAVLAQVDSTNAPNVCPERYSVFENGVLIYECEIIDRAGVFTVAERDRAGIITERPATTLEISSYVATLAERECESRKQSARVELATPIARVDIDSLATRIAALESVAAECVQ